MFKKKGQPNLDLMAGKDVPFALNETETHSMLSVLKGECGIKEEIIHPPLGDLARASSLLSGWSGPSIITLKEFETLPGNPHELIIYLQEKFG